MDSDKYRDLAHYAIARDVSVSKVMNRLIDSLILGESTIDPYGSNVMALKRRVERLEELLTGKGDNLGDGKSPETRKQEGMSKEEVAEVVAQIMDGREKEVAKDIALDDAERIEKGETELTYKELTSGWLMSGRMTGKGDNLGDGKSPETRKKEGMSREEVAEVVAQIMDGREKEMAQDIALDDAERIEKGETELTYKELTSAWLMRGRKSGI